MSSAKPSHEAIKDEVSEHFRPIDNMLRDPDQEARVIISAKANFLARSAVGTGKFPLLIGQSEPQGSCYSFAKGNDGCQKIEILLPAKFDIGDSGTYTKDGHVNHFLESVFISKTSKSNCFHSLELVCRPCLNNIPGRKEYRTPYASETKNSVFERIPKQENGLVTSFIIGNENECLYSAVKYLSRHTFIDILHRINHKVSEDRVFSILYGSKCVYDCFRTVNNNCQCSNFFDYDSGNEFDKYLSSDANNKRLELVENVVSSLLRDPSFEYQLDESLETAGEDFYKAAYPFRDKSGDVQQVAVKVFDWQRQSKLLVPFTAWPESGQPKPLHLPIPFPSGKQLLFNLDKLASRPQAAVILTDSIELADLNQSDRNHEGFVWTSWLCEEGAYEQVDWSPLQGREIFILVTNHSGVSLAEQVLKAKKLADFLADKLPETPALNFIVAETDYGDRKYGFAGIGEFSKYWQEHKPKLIPDSVIIMSKEELAEANSKVEAHLKIINRRVLDIISMPEPEVKDDFPNKSSHKAPNEKIIPNEYLLRPIIKKGDITFLYAQPGVGKSNLTLSICASILFGKPLFEDVWWTVPNSVAGKVKILYIDFEHPEKDFEKRKTSFFKPYACDDNNDRKNIEMNFLPVLMIKDGFVDLLMEKGQDYVMDKIKELENTGDKEIPVGLVVIDTYIEMLGGTNEHDGDWGNKATKLISKLTSKGISVLILDHLNNQGEPQGHANKRRKAQYSIDIKKDDGAGKEITDPTRMSFIKARFAEIKQDLAEFYFKYNRDTKMWEVASIEGDEWKRISKENYKKEFFCGLVESCNKGGFNKDAFADMLGMSPNTYRKLCDEYGISKKAKKAKEAASSSPEDNG